MQKRLSAFGRFRFTAMVLVLLSSFLSCSKDDSTNPSGNNNPSGCTAPAAPTVGSNSPVATGATINLTATTVAGATGYNWSGPNGWSSSVQNPTITNATSASAGTYTVTVTVTGGCTSSASTTVAVNISAPCNPINNQYTLSGWAVSVSPFAPQFGVGTSGNYEITCNGANGDIHFQFATPNKPTPGIYNVVNPMDPLAPATDVLISNTTQSAYWSTPSGLLYVTDGGNGKNVYTYCNLTFSNSTFGTSATGSGKITEP